MTSAFGSFDSSPLGGFVESPLGARGLGGVFPLYLLGGDLTGGDVLYWSGTAWAAIDTTGVTVPVRRIAWWDSHILIATDVGPMRWTGAAWEDVDIAGGAQVLAVADFAVFGGALYAAGWDKSPPDYGARPCVYNATTGAFDLDGTPDGIGGSDSDGRNGALVVFGGDLYLLCPDDTVGQVYRRNGGDWDRITPISQPSPVLDSDGLTAAGAAGAAVGSTMIVAGFAIDGDGATTPTPIAYTGGDESNFAAVDDTLSGGEYAWQTEIASGTPPLIQTNAVAWQGAVYMGGAQYDGSTDRGLLRVTPSAITRPVDTNTGRVRAVADAGESLLIAGTFSAGNGTSADRVALWDGSTLTAFGANPAAGTIHCAHVILGDVEPPTIDAVAQELVVAGSAYSRQVVATGATLLELAEGPSGMTMSASGLIEWDPTVKAGSPHDVIVYAANSGGWGVQSWTIVAQDTAPTINAIADDTAYTNFNPYIKSPSLASGDTPVTWSFDVSPTGATIDASSGVISWTAVDGVHDWTVRATNAVGADTESWQTTVSTL